LRRVRKNTERDQAVAQAQIAAARQGGKGSKESWKRLDDACRRLESELINPSTARQRLDEGRRSAVPKIEKMAQEQLEPYVTESKGQLVAQVRAERIDALAAKLPEWILEWAKYTYRNIEGDRALLIDQLWRPQAGDLPLPPPRIRPLDLPKFVPTIEFPKISIHRKVRGGIGNILMKSRSALYGFLSFFFLLGINLRGQGGEKLGWKLYAVLLVVAGAAFAVGLIQSRQEHEREIERLSDTVRQRADQAIRDTLRSRMDRFADKIQQDLKEQLAERRRDLVRWYRSEVLPAVQRRNKASSDLGAEADEARRRQPRLKERQRDTKRALDALNALAQLVERALPSAQADAAGDRTVRVVLTGDH
jgi:hypothetical protein